MGNIRQALLDMKNDVYNFVDKWNTFGLLVITVVLSWAILEQNFTTNLVLVVFTAAYTFVTFNQMRETRWSRKHPGTLTLRPDFEWDDDRDTDIFGLRNFGTGPAINLRGCAIIRDGNGKDASRVWEEDGDHVLRFPKKDNHLSLKEGELLPLTEGSHYIGNHFNNLWNEDGDLKRKYEGKQMELYYTFESNTGEPYPRDWSKPTEIGMEEVIEMADAPRTVRLSEIVDKCR